MKKKAKTVERTQKKRIGNGAILQADRQSMIPHKSGETYCRMRNALDSQKEEEKLQKRGEVYIFFDAHIRRLLEVNKAYSIGELLDMYTDACGPHTGLFYHTMLNKSEIFNVYHIKAMPTHVMVDYVPEDAVTGYSKKIENLKQKAIEFMDETGLQVILPREMSEDYVKDLYSSAMEVYESRQCRKATKWSSEHSSLSPRDFRTMTQMGIEFTKLKTVSAFWIEE